MKRLASASFASALTAALIATVGVVTPACVDDSIGIEDGADDAFADAEGKADGYSLPMTKRLIRSKNLMRLPTLDRRHLRRWWITPKPPA